MSVGVDPATWPIHSKAVETVIFSRLERLVERRLAANERYGFRRAWKHFSTARPESYNIIRHQRFTHDANVTKAQLKTLIGHKIIKPLLVAAKPQPSSALRVRIFLVAEHEKRRWRVICEAEANDGFELSPEERIELPTVSECKRTFQRYRYFACVDLTSWYYQFKILNAQHTAQFTHGGEHFTFERMPMGHRASATVANCATLALAREAMARAALAAPAHLEVYIDNVRFATMRADDAQKVVKSFFDVCAETRVTVNESRAETLASIGATSHKFLGIEYSQDGNKKFIALSRSFVESIKRLTDGKDPTTLSFRTLERVYGKIRYAAEALALPLGDFYNVIKFFRRRSASIAQGTFSRHDNARWWPCITGSWQTLVRIITTSGPKELLSISQTTRRMTMFTDASSCGFGAILFRDDGTYSAFGAKWTTTEANSLHINILEAIAVLEALQHFSKDLQDVLLDLRIDNTAVMYSVRSTNSKSYTLNKIVTEISNVISEITARCSINSIEYVETQRNAADPWSRIFEETSTFVFPSETTRSWFRRPMFAVEQLPYGRQ